MTERALILKEPWATLVVKGKKTIEIRTRPTTKIGQEIYIAKAGTKTLIGQSNHHRLPPPHIRRIPKSCPTTPCPELFVPTQ